MKKLLPVAMLAALLLSTLPAAPAMAIAYDATVEITFPADPRVRFSDTFDACRSGCARIHQATDLMGEKMWRLYAAFDGEVCGIDEGTEDSYGRHITICGDDGRRYRYLHLNNDTPGTDDGAAALEHVYAPGIRRGVRVARGQFIAYLGDSGNAEGTAPHLHFDMYDPTVLNPYGEDRMNPYPSLLAALQRGDIPDGSAFYADPADRAAGSDRVGTALELARGRFTGASAVVVAPSTTPGEAIVAGPLAFALDAPVLVTAPDGLDPRVGQAIADLGATEVWLIGAVLPGAAADALAGLGIAADHVHRLGSADIFETAAAVAGAVWTLQGAGDALEGSIEGEVAHDHVHPKHEHALHVSSNADRSGAVLLDGATIGGEVAIVLDAPDPAQVLQVAFHVDGAAEALHVEGLAPYDLAGGTSEAANLLPTADLGNGTHEITAQVSLTDGSILTVTAPFTVGTASGVTGDPIPATTVAPRLDVSAAPDRSEPFLLDGARVSDDVHVHLTGPDPSQVARVRWWLDDPERHGAPRSEEGAAPWDLAGTRQDGTARPLDTSTLSNGTHTVTAEVVYTDATTAVLTATFDVHNVQPRRAIVALGAAPDPNRTWPDSLVAGYYGSLRDRPVLLTRTDQLPAPTATALAGVTDVTIIGGPAAVADGTATAIDALVGTVQRLWGQDRYQTALAVVDDLLQRQLVDDVRVWAATGLNWPDAATAGPIVAGHGEVLVLIDGNGTGGDGSTRDWLVARAGWVESGRVIGGPVAINDGAVRAFRMSIT